MSQPSENDNLLSDIIWSLFIQHIKNFPQSDWTVYDNNRFHYKPVLWPIKVDGNLVECLISQEQFDEFHDEINRRTKANFTKLTEENNENAFEILFSDMIKNKSFPFLKPESRKTQKLISELREISSNLIQAEFKLAETETWFLENIPKDEIKVLPLHQSIFNYFSYQIRELLGDVFATKKCLWVGDSVLSCYQGYYSYEEPIVLYTSYKDAIEVSTLLNVMYEFKTLRLPKNNDKIGENQILCYIKMELIEELFLESKFPVVLIIVDDRKSQLSTIAFSHLDFTFCEIGWDGEKLLFTCKNAIEERRGIFSVGKHLSFELDINNRIKKFSPYYKIGTEKDWADFRSKDSKEPLAGLYLLKLITYFFSKNGDEQVYPIVSQVFILHLEELIECEIPYCFEKVRDIFVNTLFKPMYEIVYELGINRFQSVGKSDDFVETKRTMLFDDIETISNVSDVCNWLYQNLANPEPNNPNPNPNLDFERKSEYKADQDYYDKYEVETDAKGFKRRTEQKMLFSCLVSLERYIFDKITANMFHHRFDDVLWPDHKFVINEPEKKTNCFDVISANEYELETWLDGKEEEADEDDEDEDISQRFILYFGDEEKITKYCFNIQNFVNTVLKSLGEDVYYPCDSHNELLNEQDLKEEYRVIRDDEFSDAHKAYVKIRAEWISNVPLVEALGLIIAVRNGHKYFRVGERRDSTNFYNFQLSIPLETPNHFTKMTTLHNLYDHMVPGEIYTTGAQIGSSHCQDGSRVKISKIYKVFMDGENEELINNNYFKQKLKVESFRSFMEDYKEEYEEEEEEDYKEEKEGKEEKTPLIFSEDEEDEEANTPSIFSEQTRMLEELLAQIDVEQV